MDKIHTHNKIIMSAHLSIFFHTTQIPWHNTDRSNLWIIIYFNALDKISDTATVNKYYASICLFI